MIRDFSPSRSESGVASPKTVSLLRRRRRMISAAVAGVALAGLLGSAAFAHQNRANQRPNQPAQQPARAQDDQPNIPHAGMLRFPDISQDSIVFGYANDLWIVPKDGGMARPLASPPGAETFPKFSPDGKRIAFVGNYEGDRDIYIIDSYGGSAQRVTYHPANENLNGWIGNDKIHFATGGMGELPVARQTQQLFVQHLNADGPTGALAEQLPVPWGQSADISPDGKLMAFIPHSTDFRTWKRYRGGMATDVWLFNLEDKSATQVTNWEGTDTAPMLHNGKVYYLSDNNDSHRLNLFSYDPQARKATQLTKFADFDVRFPSMGPGDDGEGEIVFQQGTRLYTLSLANGSEPRAVEVIIPGAKPTMRPRIVDTENFLRGGDLGPTGKQVAVEARGDIWTLPAATGHPVHLANSDGSAERSPSWSPDGKWLAYSSDADGEYNIYLKRADDTNGEAQRITDISGRFWSSFDWAPDAKKMIAQDQTGRLTLVTLTDADGKVTAETKEIERDPTGNSMPISWSHDSNWIAYHRGDDSALTTAVYLMDLKTGEKHKVTSDMFNAQFPTFDRKGDWLYYVSQIDFGSPDYSSADTTFVYRNLDRLVAVPLRKDVKNPMIKELDKEKPKDAKSDEKKEEEARPSEGERPAGDGPRRRGRPGGGGAEVGLDDQALIAQDQPTTKPATQPTTQPVEDEKTIAEKFKLDSPVHGEWSGQLKGLKAVGAPDDEAELTMTIFAHADGSFTGSSEAMGQKRDFDSVTFDAASGQFTATRSQGPMSTTLSGKIEGESIEGTWEAKMNGAAMGNGTWSASKSGPISAEKLAAAAGAGKGGASDKPLTVDIEGFEARAILLPISRGNFSSLSVNDKNQLIYVRQGAGGPGGGGPPQPGAQPAEGGPGVKLLDITEDEIAEGSVIGGVMGYDMSADGKKLLVYQMGGGGGQGGPPGGGRGAGGGGRRAGVINAAKGQQISKTVPMTGLTKRIDPKEEWKQIVRDAWRRQRDFFYVENMHGVDWDKTLDAYLPMVDDAVSREDVSYIISEMISELNIGHAYYSGGDPGDVQDEPNRNVGMLGVDFELANSGEAGEHGYRIKKIYTGGSYDLDARGPLSMPGVDVSEGDFILAVNGQKLDPKVSPFAAFIGLAGRPTTLVVSDKPNFDAENKKQREVVVTPINSEGDLRYRDWIAHNAKVVDEASGGRIGYIYVPNTGTEGQNDLFRQFYGQMHKDALIIDERWNGGGQIPTRFIELLNRPPTNMWARRYGRDWNWPPDGHYGPKAMLINGLAGSGGDMFPWLFKHNNLGKLIGTRTWGGLVGISGVPPLVDGGSVTVPNFGFYEVDGTWGVEGHGVDPDIEVIADPSKMQDGRDIQIQAAIDHLMKELETNPPQKPKRPADPDRRGMGIPEEDH